MIDNSQTREPEMIIYEFTEDGWATFIIFAQFIEEGEGFKNVEMYACDFVNMDRLVLSPQLSSLIHSTHIFTRYRHPKVDQKNQCKDSRLKKLIIIYCFNIRKTQLKTFSAPTAANSCSPVRFTAGIQLDASAI